MLGDIVAPLPEFRLPYSESESAPLGTHAGFPAGGTSVRTSCPIVGFPLDPDIRQRVSSTSRRGPARRRRRSLAAGSRPDWSARVRSSKDGITTPWTGWGSGYPARGTRHVPSRRGRDFATNPTENLAMGFLFPGVSIPRSKSVHPTGADCRTNFLHAHFILVTEAVQGAPRGRCGFRGPPSAASSPVRQPPPAALVLKRSSPASPGRRRPGRGGSSDGAGSAGPEKAVPLSCPPGSSTEPRPPGWTSPPGNTAPQAAGNARAS